VVCDIANVLGHEFSIHAQHSYWEGITDKGGLDYKCFFDDHSDAMRRSWRQEPAVELTGEVPIASSLLMRMSAKQRTGRISHCLSRKMTQKQEPEEWMPSTATNAMRHSWLAL
jgi:hypothetical protein